MLSKIFENLEMKKPLIHNITNYVTVNDCANILLASGASPIMADDISEVEEITSICNGLNINIGTLNKSTVESMIIAGKKANELNHPVVLDPVGVGASSFRTETVIKLISEIQFSVIKGNISEIKTLMSKNGNTRGVDASEADIVTGETLEETIKFAKKIAIKVKAVIVITGVVDIVTDGSIVYVINNGNKMMSEITGTGCMLNALLTAYVAANTDNIIEAVVAGVCAMGLCGEIAFNNMQKKDGNSTYRNKLVDAMYNLDKLTFERGIKYEMRK
jgi:hydroxyethylthiazole kinase